MKRNLVLVVLLGGLLWSAWYWEHRDQKVEGIFGTVHWEDIVSIEMPEVTLKKMDDKWIVSDTGGKVDVEKVKALWGVLGNIWTEREITDQGVSQPEAFPPASQRLIIHFDRGRVEMLLGNKLSFDQSFYLETVNVRGEVKSVRRWIARDTSPEPGIYNAKTVYRSPAKYQRIKSLLQLKADDFHFKEQS